MPVRRHIIEVVRFGFVGLCATMLYVSLAFFFATTFAQLPSVAAAVAAYLLAGLFSYLAHKVFTFASDGRHRREAPRFAVVSLAGFAMAALLPLILHDMMGFTLVIPVMLTATLVPAMNFVALRWFVFDQGATGEAGMS